MRERLQQAMEARGWGPTEFARQLDVRQATVSAWFRDESPSLPSADILMKIPEALGIDGHWLLTGRGTMKPTPPSEAERLLQEARRLLCDADTITGAGE